LLWKQVSCVWTQHGAVGKKESCVGVEGTASEVRIPPTAKLINDLGVAIARQKASGWIHTDYSFTRSLQLNEVVPQTQRLKFFV
jgi:hypothetical protein